MKCSRCGAERTTPVYVMGSSNPREFRCPWWCDDCDKKGWPGLKDPIAQVLLDQGERIAEEFGDEPS